MDDKKNVLTELRDGVLSVTLNREEKRNAIDPDTANELEAIFNNAEKDPAVGAMTICSSIMQVLSMVFMGLAQGTQPIVGFNYGAGKTGRVKQAFRILMVSGMIYSVCMWGLIMLFPQVPVGLLNDKPDHSPK